VEPGDPAPHFALVGHDGVSRTLEDYRGRRVVLYFYPEDDTPTCTVQACEFRTHWRTLQAAGIDVVGISPDDTDSHERFRRKFRLPFTLLSDPGHATAIAYGVWGEKVLYGRRYIGLHRTTFVIGPDGVVTHRFERVRTKGHGARIVAALGA
jgi:peroxiredoxin Q/BCP